MNQALMKQRNGLYMHCVLKFQKGTIIQGVFPESGLCPFLDTESIKYDSPSFKFNPFVISLKLHGPQCAAPHI